MAYRHTAPMRGFVKYQAKVLLFYEFIVILESKKRFLIVTNYKICVMAAFGTLIAAYMFLHQAPATARRRGATNKDKTL